MPRGNERSKNAKLKVIVAGSLGINDYRVVWDAIDLAGLEIGEVVSRSVHAVDRIGERWARWHGVPVTRFRPSPGLGRTEQLFLIRGMSKYADALVVAWDSMSGGTQDLIDDMLLLDKPVFIYWTTERRGTWSRRPHTQAG